MVWVNPHDDCSYSAYVHCVTTYCMAICAVREWWSPISTISCMHFSNMNPSQLPSCCQTLHWKMFLTHECGQAMCCLSILLWHRVIFPSECILKYTCFGHGFFEAYLSTFLLYVQCLHAVLLAAYFALALCAYVSLCKERLVTFEGIHWHCRTLAEPISFFEN